MNLFLETLMAAREQLHLFHVGEGVQDGKPRNPAAPLAELIDVLDVAAGIPADAGAEARDAARPWQLKHPLQPFDARAFDPAQRVLHPLGDVALDGTRHQVDDAFAVAAGLEDRAALDQFAPQRHGVGDVAVVGDGAAAHLELGEQRLHVAETIVPSRRIAVVADSNVALEGFQQGFIKNIRDQPHVFEHEQAVFPTDSHASGFLATVLDGVEAKVG